MQGKAVVLLAALVLALAMLACGDFNDSSPMLDAAQRTAQEVGK